MKGVCSLRVLKLGEIHYYVSVEGCTHKSLPQQAFWQLVFTPISLKTCHLIFHAQYVRMLGFECFVAIHRVIYCELKPLGKHN